jgi:hypothetical protein
MGQRVYVASIDNVSIGTAVQDIFSLLAGSANGIEIHHIFLGAAGVTAAAELRMRLKCLPATVTNGSGGSSPTKNPIDSGDTKAATATVHANDTTQATSSGTVKNLMHFQWDVLLPFEYLPAPEDRPVCQAAEAFILDLPATIAATTVSGFIKWRELP